MKLNDLLYITLTEVLRDILSDGIHEIVFTKKDGSERTMDATLDPTIINLEVDGSEPQVLPPQYTNFYVTEVVGNDRLLKNFILKNLKSVDGVPVQHIMQRYIENLMQ